VLSQHFDVVWLTLATADAVEQYGELLQAEGGEEAQRQFDDLNVQAR
jgi:hypothetical protein